MKRFRDPKAFSDDPLMRELQEAAIEAADDLDSMMEFECARKHPTAARLRAALKAQSDAAKDRSRIR